MSSICKGEDIFMGKTCLAHLRMRESIAMPLRMLYQTRKLYDEESTADACVDPRLVFSPDAVDVREQRPLAVMPSGKSSQNPNQEEGQRNTLGIITHFALRLACGFGGNSTAKAFTSTVLVPPCSPKCNGRVPGTRTCTANDGNCTCSFAEWGCHMYATMI
jgi:hypothetical protein